MQNTLFVNLSTGEIQLKKTDSQLWQKYLGARGYAARLLFDMTGPDTDPLGEENPLIFAIGPLTGSNWPTSARYSVTTKSPLTGVYGVANSGGFFGPEMRRAGLDAVVITGRSRNPVSLIIDQGQIHLADASGLWGKATRETEDYYKEKYSGCKVAGIGPAGENLVRIAAVINDYHRAAARCGVGAVMGSKNLKALVVRGSSRYQYPEAFVSLAREKFRHVAQAPATEFYRKFGTAGLVEPKNTIGDLPSYNHREGQFDGGKKINAFALQKYTTKRKGCFACPIKCSPCTEVEEGPFQCETEGPEYETINSLGPNLGSDNLEAIIYGNKLCNEMGLDTISAGCVIAFALECREQGIPLPLEGMDLKWGDPDTINKLLVMIARREGLGDLLADGVRIAAAKLGPEAAQYALHVKGMEIPMQEPRVAKAFGLGHVTSNRGADHLYALPTIDIGGLFNVAEKYFPDMIPEIMEVTSEKYKPEMIKFTEEYNAVIDSLGICKFSTSENYAIYPEDLAQALELLGFEEMDEGRLLLTGERIINLERLYNVRLGLDRKDDCLPARFLKEDLKVYQLKEDGSLAREALAKSLSIDIEAMLDRYYRLRGWEENGIPGTTKLTELQLETE